MSFHLAPNLSFDIAIGAGVLGVACALFCVEPDIVIGMGQKVH